MNPGVYADLSNAQYHGGAGVSKSGLDLVARVPLLFKAVHDTANDNERVPTEAQALGTAFHALVLEPAEFVKDYTLALRPSDVPNCIEGRDALVAIVAELNATRLPKLSTTGTKDELVARVKAAEAEMFAPEGRADDDVLGGLKGAELKAVIDKLNALRTGLLPDKGTIAELAAIIRAEGREITVWTEAKATWLENNGHRIVLSSETWEQLHNMRDAVMAHPAARALLTNVPGKAELSVYWNDPATGELCRCRPDYWRDDGVIVDVKTTLDASPEGFGKSIANYRYHVQHPFYLDGINAMREQLRVATQDDEFPPAIPARARAFVFLAVEKTARVVDGKALGVGVYSLDENSIALGRAEYQRDMNTYHECRETGVWPGYGDKIQSISVPAWHLNKNAQLLGDAA